MYAVWRRCPPPCMHLAQRCRTRPAAQSAAGSRAGNRAVHSYPSSILPTQSSAWSRHLPRHRPTPLSTLPFNARSTPSTPSKLPYATSAAGSSRCPRVGAQKAPSAVTDSSHVNLSAQAEMAESEAEAALAAANALFASAMPKEEIGAMRLLKDHPTYDGRGCIVAIFDTGVDPAAAGLATTTDGKPKVVDLVDGTGSGDVEMSVVVDAEGGKISGLYERELTLNPEWKNPTGKWRVGAKPLFELYPGGCKRRIMEKRKELWLVQQRKALADAVAALHAFKSSSSDSAVSGTKATRKERLEELEGRVKLLKGHAESHVDEGPLLHCVVWHDGSDWRTAIETADLFVADSGEGLLADFTPMTDFRKERQFATFSALDACNFAVNVYDDGGTLSIVTDTGEHGTHVAGITAAHHPDNPALNGVAPGAQIVSCKIGDTRVRGMETGPGLVRALGAVLDAKCDVINMSYGEPTMTPNVGRFVDIANEIVNDHGVIFVASAGNNGPGLSTVGAPGGTSSSIISIGAYVSPTLAEAAHSTREAALPEGWKGQQYNWSSRGPTADGDTGVSICAPGAAIAPVPQWAQQSRQLMNGTSMSSPNAAGGVALLVSALKQEGQPVTPARVRRAVENTASTVHSSPEDTLAYGCGLLQVDAALAYLQRSKGLATPESLYKVRVQRSSSSTVTRGVYLRDAAEAAGSCLFSVTLSPHLHRNADIREERLLVEDKLSLRLKSASPWVSAPSQVLVPHNGRTFDLCLDTSALAPGLHYEEVEAWDAAREWRGPVARVPITVCKPALLPGAQEAACSPDKLSVELGPMQFVPGREHRRYVQVPAGATWAEMTVRAGTHDTPKLFMVHTTQLLPHTRPGQHRQTLTLSPGEAVSSAFPVTGGVGLEVAAAQFWKSDGAAELSVEVSFHGVEVSRAEVALQGTSVVAQIQVHAPLRSTKLGLSAKLNTLHIPLRPVSAELSTAATRGDTMPGGRVMHHLALSYKLKLQDPASVTPVVVPLRKAVYDGAMEGQVYAMYDSNKKRVAFGDVYPSPVSLDKGEYTVVLKLRHDSVKVLDSLKDLPLRVDVALASEVTVAAYRTLADALSSTNAAKNSTLRQGERAAFFIGPVPEDSLPKDAAPGCTVSGPIKVAKLSGAAGGGGGLAPSSTRLLYTVLPASKRKENEEASDKKENDADAEKRQEKERDSTTESAVPGEEADAATVNVAEQVQTTLREARRDSDIKILTRLKRKTAEQREAFDSVAQELSAAWPTHLPLFTVKLKRTAEALKEEKASGDALAAIVAAADDVIGMVDEVAVAQFVAWKDKEEAGEEKQRKALKDQKSALIEALHTKCKATLALAQAAERETAAGEAEDAALHVGPLDSEAGIAFEVAYKELSKWVDIQAVDYVGIYAARQEHKGHLANAIAALDKCLGDKDKKAGKELWKQKACLLRSLGWDHWAILYESQAAQAFPDQIALL